MKYIKKYDLLDDLDSSYVHNDRMQDLFNKLDEVKKRDSMLRALLPNN